MAFKFVLQFVDAVAECLEVAHVENLASDVEMQSHHLHMLQLGGMLDNGNHIAHGDAELVLGQSRCNVGVGVSTDIGIQPERHAGHFAFCLRQLVDDLQLRNTLNVKAENVAVESEVYLPVAFANTGKNDL